MILKYYNNIKLIFNSKREMIKLCSLWVINKHLFNNKNNLFCFRSPCRSLIHGKSNKKQNKADTSQHFFYYFLLNIYFWYSPIIFFFKTDRYVYLFLELQYTLCRKDFLDIDCYFYINEWGIKIYFIQHIPLLKLT